ncbi:MAG TPA: hypothetical protein VFS00_00950 [Polyangiaceae bacterium]|nr:hypothetical protein [Polyangiaceae bacterium]
MTRFRLATTCWAAGALSGALALGCADQSGYAGLANVPNPNRPWSSDDLGRDSVANGSESCGAGGAGADDPLRNRIPPCPEQPPPTQRKRPAKPAPSASASAAAAPATPATPAAPATR